MRVGKPAADRRHQRMVRALQAYKEALVAAEKSWKQRREGSVGASAEDQVEKLRSLGYIQ